jgi:septal ring factor EnvC (AmiA/AmiB activator)
MAKDLDYARFLKDCRKLTNEEARELKRLYQMIVKEIHPDVYSHLEEKDKLYWSRAVEAYEKGDLEMLRTLRELIDDQEPKEAEKGSALEELADKQEQLLSTVKHLLEAVDRIKKAFPFTEEEFLADKEKVAAKRANLKAAVKESREILEDYQFRLTLFTKPESSIIC